MLQSDVIAQRALEAWLTDRLPDLGDLVITDMRRPGVGMSGDTLLIDLRGSRKQPESELQLVLRQRKEGNDLLLNSDLRWQYDAMQALAGIPEVPVPAVLDFEADSAVIGSEFFVMRRVAGRALPQVPNYNVSSWLADSPRDCQRSAWLRMVEALALVHRVPLTADFGFMYRLADGKPGLEQHLNHLDAWFAWASGRREQPVTQVALAWLHQHRPANAAVELLWGDPIPANMIFSEEFRINALLDWEMAGLGPGELDLAWFLMFDDFYSHYRGISRLPGLPARAEMIETYESISGRPVENLDYYYLLALLRFAIIFMRASDQYAASRGLGAEFDAGTHNPITAEIARRLDLPVPHPGAGWARMMTPAPR